MRNLLLVLACLLLACGQQLSAQRKSLGPVSGVSRIENGVEVASGTAKVRVTAVAENTLHILVSPSGSFSSTSSWAVIASPASPDMEISENADNLVLTIPGGQARINRNPLRIDFLDRNGQVVNEEATPMAFDGASFRVTRKMPETEMYFGLGDKTSLNLRDHVFTFWNTDAYGWQESTDPLYKTIPFFTAMHDGKAYGIFMDNPWRSSFNFGKERHDAYSFGAEGGELDYYFFFGPSPKRVLGSYADLTGKSPLPPLWSLGYQQCRYSYYPEARVREIAKTFRDKQIPADVIYLDIDYQDGYRPFTINRQYFPHFEDMVKDLRQQGFSPIAITDLHIAKADYPPYNEGHAKDLFVKNPDGSEYVGKVWPGDSVFPEFTMSKAREWWGTLYKDFVGMGIRGFWNDMNEPSVFRPTKTMPLEVTHRLDDGSTIPHLAAHNVFGMQNSRGTYEGLLKLEGDERPFVLTRATYAGGQRYAATWTGDNSSTWNHMRMSVPTLLNLGISGYPLVGDDIGGYAGSPTAELVTRWMLLGAFNPIFRNHTEKGSNSQEPWAFGPEYEKYMKASIERRYRMLPYIYTATEEASSTGIPIMRPLFLEFPNEQWLNDNQREFMFGPSMLVAPKVSETMDAYNVELPSGIWYDYWTGAKYAGGEPEKEKLKVKPAINEIPVFVKAGSIIPEQPVVQSTAFVPQGPLELRVYPGPNCSGQLYQDDGHTFDYRSGGSMRLAMSCSASQSSASLTLAPQQGTYKPWFTHLRVTFFDIPKPAPSVTVDGASAQGTYNTDRHSVTVLAPYNPGGTTIKVAY